MHRLPSRFSFLLLAAIIAATPAVAARRRAAAAPAQPCVFQVASQLPDPVPDGGASGLVSVALASGNCSEWRAFSDVSWVTISPVGEPGTGAQVTVQANTTSEIRTARLTVAGVGLTLTQLPFVPPPDTNLLINATFDADIAHWSWYDDYPNSFGTASWSSVDANGNPASGSILLRDTMDGDPAFQRLQCFAVAPSQTYQWGAALETGPVASGAAALAFFEFPTPDCSGTYTQSRVKTIVAAREGVWQRVSDLARTRATAQSALVVIGSYAKEPLPYEVRFDDLYFRPKP